MTQSSPSYRSMGAPAALAAGFAGRAVNSSFVLSSFLSSLIALFSLLNAEETVHWFILPVLLCGMVIGIDAIDWARGRLALFDPAGLLGLLGFHFFFLAPILMVIWNYRMRYLADQPSDYRDWLGGMAALNFAGLLVYRSVYKVRSRPRASSRLASRLQSAWLLEPKRFWILLLLTLTASGALQAWVYFSLGGIVGYINAYTAWLGGRDEFRGTALLFTAAESFPVVAMMGFAVLSRRLVILQRSFVVFLALAGFFVLELVFGGLRGSRSNTIWGLFWAAGIIHLFVRPLPRSVVIGSIPCLLLFVSVYAAYKQRGAEILDIASAGSSEELSNAIEGPAVVLLSDFARSDVQAFLLYRIVTDPEAIDYAMGQSYVGAAAMLVPRSVWDDRPPTKMKWTTEAETGIGSYQPGVTLSSRVYGLGGEAMLNFGLFFVPVAYAVLGLAVRKLRAFAGRLGPSDTRLLMIPFLANFCFILLLNDSDNDVFYLIKYGLIPALFIVLSSRRCLLAHGTQVTFR